ncbi:MAG: D-glycero-alpha-D-manno-heptose-7-phosphate kinase [Parcubacteria group bacterium Gr01-1014_70]|nr:MAG: D-glycero-alpha-D-manno-heptose-7-phosphate kinase [Parcubacteria group bacterium Gr01-1014_70]
MIIARAPFRISFFGGGTDHPEFFLKEGGAVLSTAIDKYVYVTANRFLSHMYDYAIRLSYSSVELAKNLNDVEHNIFRECLRYCGVTKDIALHSAFDAHAFSGLGSSSSLTVSILHALHCINKEFITPEELARAAIFVEKKMVKDKVGYQDQIAAAYGGFNFIEFKPTGDFHVQCVHMQPSRMVDIESHLFLVYTGIVRKASDITALQIKKIQQNMLALRALKAMAYDGYDLLIKNKPLKKFGLLLNEAWVQKRTLDSGVSNEKIDALYKRGLKAGAWGGKLLGAGGGGFILFFAPPSARAKLAKSFPKKDILPVKINAPGSQIIFS